MYSTIKFINQIKKRFGAQYKSATYKLTFILAIFSIAFLVRGSFDLWITIKQPAQQDLGFGEVGFAVFVGSFYFICEILPLFVLFMQHRKDFSRCEAENLRELTEKEANRSPVSPRRIMRQNKNERHMSCEPSEVEDTDFVVISLDNPDLNRKSEVLRNVVEDYNQG